MPELEYKPQLLPNIKDAAINGELVLFIGAGVSRLSGLPSWERLADKVLEDLISQDRMNYSEMNQLKDLNPKEKLSIAEIINNGEPLDFRNHLLKPEKETPIYDYINDIGCVYVTTNYDTLLSPNLKTSNDNISKKFNPKRISNRKEFYPRYLNDLGTVIHLHGSIEDKDSMVVTTKDYFEHYGSTEVQILLEDLFKRKTVLFIGYGLNENEILEYLLNKGNVTKLDNAAIPHKRFALQPYFENEESLFIKLHKYYSDTFKLQLIGYIRDERDYRQLEIILQEWSMELKSIINPPSLSEDLHFMDEVLNGKKS